LDQKTRAMKTLSFNDKAKHLLILITLLVICLKMMAVTPEEEFRLMKQKNGIDLFYRWMVMPEGNRVRQMKAVFEGGWTKEDIMYLLKNEQQAMAWIPSAREYRNLKEATAGEWFSYIRFSAPWPLADQDCILQYSLSTEPSGESTIRFTCRPDYIPEVDGITRMKDINGSFVICPGSGEKGRVECYFISSKASVIPRWITDPIITGSIISLMEGMRGQLSGVEYSQTLQK